jgi:fluoride exporter
MSKRMNNKKLYFFVGLGGMVGATLRYSISLLIGKGDSFPFDTLLVNLTGCFILSYLLHHNVIKSKLKQEYFTGLTTGVIGSFTTFSTFSIEVVTLSKSSVTLAMIYIATSVVGGIFLCYIGYLCAVKRRESR